MPIARLLYDLVKKNQKWDWTKKGFKKLKKRFTKELVLAVLKLDKKNENGSGYIRLYNRRSFIYGV